MEPTSPSPLALPVLPSRRLRWLAATLRVLLWLVAAGWLLFGLSWFVLHGWIVPRIGELRPRLELEASRALGMPVRIGSISARSPGAIPSFELHDVRLLDSAGREAVRLPHLIAALSVTSLWGLGFEQLVIERPELDIRRTADGRIFVGGLELSATSSGGHSALADWFFSQSEFVLRGGTVRWSDETRPAAAPLALTQVDAVLRNGHHRHQLRLDATPPPEWGERFSLRGIFKRKLLGRPGDFKGWSGQLYGESGRVDVSHVQQYASLAPLGVALNQGRGALRAWADVSRGGVTGGVADLDLQAVNVRLGERLAPLAFDALAGRVGVSENARGFALSTEGLSFRTADGLQWPGGNGALVHTRTGAGAPQKTSLKADRLDLAALAQIASRLPLASQAQALIASLAPQGLVDALDAQWQGPLDAPIGFSAKGRVTGLQLAGAAAPAGAALGTPGRPGISGARVDFDLTEAGGQASVNIAQGALELPGVFEQPRLALEQLSTQAQWTRSGQKIALQLRQLQFANADAQGKAELRWRTDDSAAATPAGSGGPDRRFPGLLDLQGSLSRGEARQVHRYLPLVLGPDVRHYVRDAVQQGQLSQVQFKVAGPLAQLPFSSPASPANPANPAQGEFRVSAKVRGGQFVYVPPALQPPGAAPWPALTELNGELVFNRAALEVNGVSARIAGLPGLRLLKGEARIADLMHNATVAVKLDIQGVLGDALGFVNGSPLAAMTAQALAQAQASGSASYRVGLELPIHAIDSSRVDGAITLAGNDVKFAPDAPTLGALKGVLTFNEKGFAVAGAQGTLFGGAVRLDGASVPQAATDPAHRPDVAFKIAGQVSAEGLRQAQELGPLARLAQHASGSTAYAAALAFRRGVAELSVSSSLQGLALDFPFPLNKAAQAALPLHFERALLPASLAPGQPLQDELSLSLGALAAIRYQRDLSGSAPRVLRGSLGVGLGAAETVPLPDSGVQASLNLARLDAEAWQKILADVSGAAPSSGRSASAQAGALEASQADAYQPSVLALRVGELRVQGHSLNQVVLGGSRDGLDWRASIDAAELSGYLDYRESGPAGPGRVYARLARLNLAPETAAEVETLLDEPPASIPALDIVVDDLALRGRKLGRIEIDAVNRGAPGMASAGGGGGVRDWHLNQFNLRLPEATLNASGDWLALAGPRAGPVSGRRRSVMDFRLDIADSGELLKRFGMDGVLRRGKGQIQGQVGWLGSPLSPHYPSLSGQFKVNVEAGQFLKADPGLAKLLGVLSLQSLPRRLTLDFRDVFSEGFAFDFVRGDVDIDKGLARTSNLQMGGVNAAVLMAGSADIVRETQNLRVLVVPELDAGTASLIAGVINPALGLGSFLAQLFLRRPLTEAATQEFQIDGAWSEPKITKIDRSAPEGKTHNP